MECKSRHTTKGTTPKGGLIFEIAKEWKSPALHEVSTINLVAQRECNACHRYLQFFKAFAVSGLASAHLHHT